MEGHSPFLRRKARKVDCSDRTRSALSRSLGTSLLWRGEHRFLEGQSSFTGKKTPSIDQTLKDVQVLISPNIGNHFALP